MSDTPPRPPRVVVRRLIDVHVGSENYLVCDDDGRALYEIRLQRAHIQPKSSRYYVYSAKGELADAGTFDWGGREVHWYDQTGPVLRDIVRSNIPGAEVDVLAGVSISSEIAAIEAWWRCVESQWHALTELRVGHYKEELLDDELSDPFEADAWETAHEFVKHAKRRHLLASASARTPCGRILVFTDSDSMLDLERWDDEPPTHGAVCALCVRALLGYPPP